MKTLSKTILAATAALGLAVSSYASPVLVIFDDTSLVAISDNGAGDTAAGAGEISWADASFGIWNLAISGVTGGSIGNPTLQLSISATSSVGGFLGVYYGDTDFGPTNSNLHTWIAGALASGQVENHSYAFDSNDVSDPGYYSSVVTTDVHTGSPFSGAASAWFSANGPYGLANAVYLETTSGGSSIIGSSLSVPDTGSTALLLAVGLFGLGAMARRQKLA